MASVLETVKVPPIGISRKYPELGTGPVPTDIYHDPAIYEKEIEAIFKRCWFMIGRVEQVAKPGEFFVYEMPTFKYSVIICRDKKGTVNAFHNVCRHRGNVVEHRKSGKCNVFTCRFHGWSYHLDGKIAGIRDEEGFFDIDRSTLNLKPIQMQIWNGFIFVSPEENPSQTVEEYLGEQGRDLNGYPFHLGTQSYKFEGEVDCNWKLAIDSFCEVYHIPVLHARSVSPTMFVPDNPNGRLLDTIIKGDHLTNSHWSTFNPTKNPVQKLAYQNLSGASVVSTFVTEMDMPKGLNETRADNWCVDLAVFMPGFAIVLTTGMYVVHQAWPLGPNRCLYQQTGYLRKAENAAQRFGQENSMIEFRDVVFEDMSTLERIQRALDTGQMPFFHYHDHEVALRHRHKVVLDKLAEYDRLKAEGAIS